MNKFVKVYNKLIKEGFGDDEPLDYDEPQDSIDNFDDSEQESSDEWPENVREALKDVSLKFEDLFYEVFEGKKGEKTNCDSVEDLVIYLKSFADEIAEVAENLDTEERTCLIFIH